MYVCWVTSIKTEHCHQSERSKEVYLYIIIQVLCRHAESANHAISTEQNQYFDIHNAIKWAHVEVTILKVAIMRDMFHVLACMCKYTRVNILHMYVRTCMKICLFMNIRTYVFKPFLNLRICYIVYTCTSERIVVFLSCHVSCAVRACASPLHSVYNGLGMSWFNIQ